jgi:hypothetical protein
MPSEEAHLLLRNKLRVVNMAIKFHTIIIPTK